MRCRGSVQHMCVCDSGLARFLDWESSAVLQVIVTETHTHTHPFNGPLSGTTRVSWYQKGKTKSASCSRQITLPKPHHSVFYRPDAFPATQPTASKHWRQSNRDRKGRIFWPQVSLCVCYFIDSFDKDRKATAAYAGKLCWWQGLLILLLLWYLYTALEATFTRET